MSKVDKPCSKYKFFARAQAVANNATAWNNGKYYSVESHRTSDGTVLYYFINIHDETGKFLGTL